jgi:hypothetical protein
MSIIILDSMGIKAQMAIVKNCALGRFVNDFLIESRLIRHCIPPECWVNSKGAPIKMQNRIVLTLLTSSKTRTQRSIVSIAPFNTFPFVGIVVPDNDPAKRAI